MSILGAPRPLDAPDSSRLPKHAPHDDEHGAGAFLRQNLNEIDPEDEMMMLHSFRRAALERMASASPSASENASGKSAPPDDVPKMMPTDLEKWSRDQQKDEERVTRMYENEETRLAELVDFINGGALLQQARFDEIIGWTQDQALPGREDSVDLLTYLQKPLNEKAAMNKAFSALEQHLDESAVLMHRTLASTQVQLDKAVDPHWISDVLMAVPSKEEFRAVVTPAERSQFGIPSDSIADTVSGFDLRDVSQPEWHEELPKPNMDATARRFETLANPLQPSLAAAPPSDSTASTSSSSELSNLP